MAKHSRMRKSFPVDLLVPWPNSGYDVLPYLLLLFPSYTVDFLRHLVFGVLLRHKETSHHKKGQSSSKDMFARCARSPFRDPPRPQSTPPPPPHAHSPSPNATASSLPYPRYSAVSWDGLPVGSGVVGGGRRSRLLRRGEGVFVRRGL